MPSDTDRGLIQILPEFLPVVMKLQRRWVGWLLVEGANGRRIKRPFNIHTGAVDAQEACRADWHEVDKAYRAGTISGYGYSLGERGSNDDVVFIDLDNAVEVTDDGNGNPGFTIKPWACDILERFEGSYIEFSPSGTGVHIIVLGRVPHSISRVKNHEGVEIYDSGRYLAMTGYVPPCIRELVSSELLDKQEALTWLYERTEAAIREAKRNTPAPKIAYTGEYADDFDYATKILTDGWLDNRVEDYGVWLEVGFALHERFGAAGIDLWDTWSQRGMNYEAGCCHAKARTFGAGSARGKARFGSFMQWVRDAGGPPQGPPATPKARMLPPTGATIQNHPAEAGSGAEDSAEQPASSTEDMNEEAGESEPMPVMSLDGRDMAMLDLWLSSIERHIHKAGMYRYQGSLARIKRERNDQTRLGAEPVEVERYNPVSIASDLTKCVLFDKYNAKTNNRSLLPPAAANGAMVLGMSDWPNTPVLRGVTTGPFMRVDGSICTANGYDSASGLYVHYSGQPVVVPDQPTDQQVVDAFELLLELTSQFEWDTPEGSDGVTPSQAASLAHLLSLVARPAITGPVPAFIYSATNKGAGKTLLATLAPLIAYGVDPSVTPCPDKGSSEELDKLIFSIALSGASSIIFDNWSTGTPVGGPTLDMVATSTTIRQRVLGTNNTPEIEWRAVVAITGNALSLKSDFSSRAVWASLKPTVEDPRSRVPDGGFNHKDIKGHVVQHRAEYLAAALTILRSHFLAGCQSSGAANWGSFNSWAAIVRNAVRNGTGVDLKLNLSGSDVSNQEDDELATLLSGLVEFQRVTDNPRWKISQIYDLAKESVITSTVMPDWVKTLSELADFDRSRVVFCKSFPVSKYIGKIHNGLKIVKKREQGRWDRYEFSVIKAK
jgi:hypothetical protein